MLFSEESEEKMIDLCLFCNELEPSYKPEIDFICGSCVQLLLGLDQAELRKTYHNALSEDNFKKMSAIESFLHEGKHYAKTQKPKRGMVRKRSVRKVRPSRDRVRA